MPHALDQTAAEELQLLRSQKETLCVSIIVPTHRLSPDRRTDELHIKKAVQRTADQLYKSYPKKAEVLLASINRLVESIDFTHNQEGLGLFVSNKLQFIVHYPFPVAPKIAIGKRFELKDTLYKSTCAFPYFVLHLGKTKASLYYGQFHHLEEVQDENFPYKFTDDYEYAHPTHATSYSGQGLLKGFEKDKSALQKVRQQSFLSKVDGQLKGYLTEDAVLLLCGSKRNTSLFMDHSQLTAKVVGIINGNYSHFSTKELSDVVAPTIKASIKEKMQLEVKQFKERRGQGVITKDLPLIEQAIKEGRGLKLLVEKDYLFREMPALDDRRRAPLRAFNLIGNSLDEDLIENMLDQQEQVVILEKNMLKGYGHISLITRY
jgi:hypothetical protein